MSGSIDPRIALQVNPAAEAGPDMGKVMSMASMAQKFMAQRQAQGQQNALRQLLGQPGAIDPNTGFPTAQAMQGAYGIDPASAIGMQENALKGAFERDRSAELQSKMRQQAIDDTEPNRYAALSAYYDAINSGADKTTALARMQESLSRSKESLLKGGTIAPHLINGGNWTASEDLVHLLEGSTPSWQKKINSDRADRHEQSAEEDRKTRLDIEKRAREDAERRAAAGGWTPMNDFGNRDADGNPTVYWTKAGEDGRRTNQLPDGSAYTPSSAGGKAGTTQQLPGGNTPKGIALRQFLAENPKATADEINRFMSDWKEDAPGVAKRKADRDAALDRHARAIEEITTRRDLNTDERGRLVADERKRHDLEMENLGAGNLTERTRHDLKTEDAADKRQTTSAGQLRLDREAAVRADNPSLTDAQVKNKVDEEEAAAKRRGQVSATPEKKADQDTDAVDADIKREHPDWTGGQVVVERVRRMNAGKAEGTQSAKPVPLAERDATAIDTAIWEAHPDWNAGQIAVERHRQLREAGQHIPFTDQEKMLVRGGVQAQHPEWSQQQVALETERLFREAGAEGTQAAKPATQAAKDAAAIDEQLAADHPDWTPADRIMERRRRLSASGTKPVPFSEAEKQAVKRDVLAEHPDWTDGQVALETDRRVKQAGAEGTAAGKPTTAANQTFRDMRQQAMAEHPDWNAAQLDAEAIRKTGEAKLQPGSKAAEHQTRFLETKAAQQQAGTYTNDSAVYDVVDAKEKYLKDNHIPADTARMLAERFVLTGDGSVMVGFGRSPAMLAELDNAITEVMREHNMTPVEMARRKVEFHAYAQGINAFTAGGKLEPAVRSLGVAVDHLDLLQQAANALAKNDTNTLNAIQNTFNREFRSSGPVTFDAIRGTVAAEIEKAVSGSAGAVSDREDLKNNLSNSRSPQQIRDVIGAYQGLMAGQLRGLQGSYQRVEELGGQRHEDFGAKFNMSPRARDVLDHAAAVNTTSARPAGYSDDQLYAAARKRIAAGKDRAETIAQLRAWGLDPGKL